MKIRIRPKQCPARNDHMRETDFNGTLFNRYNAIEDRALKGGTNITSLFDNITNTPNTSQIVSAIEQYARPKLALHAKKMLKDLFGCCKNHHRIS